jgi:hypothetical protein
MSGGQPGCRQLVFIDDDMCLCVCVCVCTHTHTLLYKYMWVCGQLGSRQLVYIDEEPAVGLHKWPAARLRAPYLFFFPCRWGAGSWSI